ncbi:MAG: TetR/AcrR family transcriptional regulator [Acetatifactor sp.]|nr:TetR/AcrR family transcriptional regulator [Acetatifactor sp.]
MPTRIVGVSAKLLEVAREEFLEKGYNGASVRDIAQKAGTSPRSVYTRFENKEALFAAVVGPSYRMFYKRFMDDKNRYWEWQEVADDDLMQGMKRMTDYYLLYLEFAYEHKEDFQLLLARAQGTRYEAFLKELADMDLSGVMRHLEDLKQQGMDVPRNPAAESFLRSITDAFYEKLFLPFLEGQPQEQARDYVVMLIRFYVHGIMGLFQ